MAPASSAPSRADPPSGPTSYPLPSTDLVTSLPPPILRLLVLFAAPIAGLRGALEVLSWQKGRRAESWLVVAVWWGVCLGSSHVFRWLLPPLLFAPLIPFSSLWLRKKTKDPKPVTTSTSSTTSPSNSLAPRRGPDDPATSHTVLSTLSDLHAIHALLPPSPLPTLTSTYARFRHLGAVRLIRGLVVLWLTWIVLGHFIVGFRALLALGGTVILLLPSPPLSHLVHLLSKSLAVRRALALVFLFTFGSPPDQSYRFTTNVSLFKWVKSKWAASRKPSQALSLPTKPPVPTLDELGVRPGDPIYFRFEVHENQRWWMGLDWTSALLPQERPSWCDSHLLPVPPPPSFTLPSPASVVLPAPTKSDPNAQVRRIATWRWIDDDWSIVRAGQGVSAPTSSQPPNASPTPSGSDDNESIASGSSERGGSGAGGSSGRRPSSGSFSSSDDGHATPTAPSTTAAAGVAAAHARAPSIAEQAFAKGLERLKARATPSPLATGGGSPVKSPELKRGRTGSQASEDVEDGAVLGPPIVEADDATDPDGWVYGDNKWENMGARGGLGKFTRRRRWQRRAVCTETVQRVLPTDPDALDPSVAIGKERPDTTPVQEPVSTLSGPTPRASGGVKKGLENSPPIGRNRLNEYGPAAPMSVIPGGGGSGGVSGGATGLGIGVGGGAGTGTEGRRSEEGTGSLGLGLGSLIPPSNSAGASGREDVLRQRLKKAMGNLGG